MVALKPDRHVVEIHVSRFTHVAGLRFEAAAPDDDAFDSAVERLTVVAAARTAGIVSPWCA